MNQFNPFAIIKQRYITEKSTVLSQLKDKKSNKSLSRCESPKYVFLVDPRSNKQQIKEAVEEIYSKKNVRVVAVNTITLKPKVQQRKGNRNPGRGVLIKKAIVTLAPGDVLED